MEKTITEKKPRLHLVDEYRGFWIINMIIYHGIWDLVYIFGANWDLFQQNWTHVWQQVGCSSFIFISGFCWQMSKHNLKRGLQVFGAGLIITAATLIFMPSSRVLFGVLTLLGSCMLLLIPCSRLFQKIHPLLGATISFLLFLFVYPVNDGYLGFAGIEMIKLPSEWYQSLLGSYLGFTEPTFWSTDYFPIFPWIFMYIVGYFTYSFLYNYHREKAIALLSKSLCPPCGWVGRNSLIIYMLHQPVIYGILTILYG